MAYPAYHAAAGPTGWYQALKDYIDAGDAGVSNFLVEHNADGTHDFPGTPTGAKFLRDDRTWAVPPSGGGALTSWFDVMGTYGGIGDGTSDDTAAVNAAVAAASAAGGGVVYFPVGTYKYASSAQLDIPSDVTLLGAGRGSILLLSATGVNGYIRMPVASSRCGLRDMTVKRGNTTGNSLLDMKSPHSAISNVRFQGNSLAGTGVICGGGADNCTFTGNHFEGINGLGLVAGGNTGMVVLGNRWSAQTGGSAISLNTNMTNFEIVSNTILMDVAATSQGIGCYTVAGGTYIKQGRINNNYIETVHFGIEVVKTSAGDQPEFVTINGNTMKALAGTYTGISTSGESITVNGNTIDCNGIANLYTGIEFAAGGNSCTANGNTIYGDGSLETGIILDKSSNCSVTGNVIRGFRDASDCEGIKIYADGTSSSDNNVISGNHIHFSAATAGSLECGVKVMPNAAGATCNRNLIVGNTIWGNNVTNSRGVSLDPGAGSLDRTLIGMNIIRNCATAIAQFGDTNTLMSGTTWNLSA